MCIRAPWWQLNRISHSGLLIIDNEGIQGGKLTTNTTFKFNWVFDAGGLGLRFDTGEEGRFGSNNNLQFNVVFRNSQGGLSGKSDNASNYRNTGTDNQGGTDVEAGGFTGGAVDMKICHCYPASCEGERSGVPVPAFTNHDSVTRGNVGIMGPGTAGGLLNPYDLPGAHDHNLNLALGSYGSTPERERRLLYRSYAHYDFRPAVGSPLIDAGAENTMAGPFMSTAAPVAGSPATVGSAPDIGAYEYGDTFFWIPGRVGANASFPIPPDGSSGVLPSADLIFLPARDATAHTLHMAPQGSALQEAATLSADRNIFTPSAPLTPGQTYSWRVDAVSADSTSMPGSVWSFTAGCEDVNCVSCGTSHGLGVCQVCEAGTELIGGLCVARGGCRSGNWSVLAIGSPTSIGQARVCDTTSAPHVCGPFTVTGFADDRFLMVESESTFCCTLPHSNTVCLDLPIARAAD